MNKIKINIMSMMPTQLRPKTNKYVGTCDVP